MADTFSSSSSSTILPILFNPQSLLSNTILTKENYLTWSSQFMAVLHTHSLEDVIHNKVAPPEKVINAANPKYHAWKNATNLVLTWIKATVSPAIQTYLVSCNNAPEAWDMLQNRFASSSKTHLHNLKHQLNSLNKDPETSMTDYLLSAKTIANSLASAGITIDDTDLIDHVMDGLGQEYRSFITSFHLHSQVSFEEFHDLLVQEETLDKRFNSLSVVGGTALAATSTAAHSSPSPSHQNSTYNNNNNRNRSRGNNSNNTNRNIHNGRRRGSSNSRSAHNGRGNNRFNHNNYDVLLPNNGPPLLPTPTYPPVQSGSHSQQSICQLCDQPGHTARTCSVRTPTAFTTHASVPAPSTPIGA